MLDYNTPYLENMHYADNELAGHVHKFDMNCRVCVGVDFLSLFCAFLPSHFAGN